MFLVIEIGVEVFILCEEEILECVILYDWILVVM